MPFESCCIKFFGTHKKKKGKEKNPKQTNQNKTQKTPPNQVKLCETVFLDSNQYHGSMDNTKVYQVH